MTRVAVIGNAGGGKSTICRALSRAYDLPLLVIDHVQWLPGWVPAPEAAVRQAHDAALARGRWIIDGWGPRDTIEVRFAAADTIILIDHPLPVHYWWVIKRQIASVWGEPTDAPPGCPLLPMTWPLLKLIWTIHRHARPWLLARVAAYKAGRTVVHLRSPRELRVFLARHTGAA
jgi:adenylate kinase family enzyme